MNEIEGHTPRAKSNTHQADLERWRKRNERFVARNAEDGKYVRINDVIDRWARDRNTLIIDETKRQTAWREFIVSALAREFHWRRREVSSSRILCLSPHAPLMRLTAKFIADRLNIYDQKTVVAGYLRWSVVPRDLAEGWQDKLKMGEPEQSPPTSQDRGLNRGEFREQGETRTKPNTIAAWLKANHPNGVAWTYPEALRVLKGAAPSVGDFRKGSWTSAKKLAYGHGAAQKRAK